MRHFVIGNNEKYYKKPYKFEDELTKIVEDHFKEIISESSVFLKAEKQFKTKNFKNSICDGFLLVWENPSTPLLYITEIELEKHSIDKHILPQIGDFISFIKSAKNEDLSKLKSYIYEKLKKDPQLFKKIQSDTDREVYELIESAIEDLQVLLIIDRMHPNLAIGLTQIEKAINLKIRKIEVSRFENEAEDEILYYSDSEVLVMDKDVVEEAEEYTLNYHLNDKDEMIKIIVNGFIKRTKGFVKAEPKKHYIGYFKDGKMIMSTVTRKKNVIFYSKAKLKDRDKKYEKLIFRDVSEIGHYTNHLPTEIIINDADSILELIDYFETNFGKK